MTLSTDLSKRSPLIVVMTVVGDMAQAPSSGQHRLQHSLHKRLRLLDLHHTSLSTLEAYTEESWALFHPPLHNHTAVYLWVSFFMDCDFCSFLFKEECKNKVCVGGCSKKSTLLLCRRKADSLVKKRRSMMQATGSWPCQFAMSIPKNFQTLKTCLTYYVFLNPEGMEPLNLLLSTF